LRKKNGNEKKLVFADIGDDDLAELIVFNATNYYKSDAACPLSWEPSGFDFLSPCMQEADLMSRREFESVFKNIFEAFIFLFYTMTMHIKF
jgi:hypothetical protein